MYFHTQNGIEGRAGTALHILTLKINGNLNTVVDGLSPTFRNISVIV